MEPLSPAVALLLVLRVVGGFPSGAPASACDSMKPGHGVPPQSSPAPYRLITSTGTFQPGRPITVTIAGPPYRGVLLEARSGSSTDAVGTWQLPPPDTRFLACAGNPRGAVTHSNTNPKGNGTAFTWTPPDSPAPVYFTATVAQQFSVYWLNVRSSTLSRGAPKGLNLASRAGRAGGKPLLLLLTCFLLLQMQS
ncbi:putative defense protein Hdd11 [Betta splendens]|uniref:Defense protein Hdd11 n=1 Tax=Betta splendens TaxID=158456 RepID=A0A6P7NJR6_BETSP|nr:putative defense protein Hdd11 [Betta splendens]